MAKPGECLWDGASHLRLPLWQGAIRHRKAVIKAVGHLGREKVVYDDERKWVRRRKRRGQLGESARISRPLADDVCEAQVAASKPHDAGQSAAQACSAMRRRAAAAAAGCGLGRAMRPFPRFQAPKAPARVGVGKEGRTRHLVVLCH